MSDLIRRSDVIKAFEDVLDCDFPYISEETPWERIEAIPTADPNDEASRAYYEGWTNGEEAERSRHQPKRGEWIDDDFVGQYRCSECDYYAIDEYDFCPNCGAQMKGADYE